MTEPFKNSDDEALMPIMDHIRELRQRVAYVFMFFVFFTIVSYLFATNIFNFLIMPLANIMEQQGGTKRMIFTDLTEGFFTYMKVAVFGSVCLTFPVFIWHLWKFVAPALYKEEKKALYPFMIASPVLFLLGAGLVYFFIIPLAWSFLMGFQTGFAETRLPIELEAKISEYLSLVMTMIMAFGICFQLPLLIVLLVYAKILSSKVLIEVRRYSIVFIFLLAAIVTPPDVISQIGLAVPLMILYEITIFSAKIVEAKRNH